MTNKIANLEDLSNIIVQGIDPDWSTLKKIRYTYLTLGEYLVKNTDFFLSVDGRLKEFNLSASRLKELYNAYPNVQDEDWFKVICRSAAAILQYCLNKLGINSKLVKSTDSSPIFDDSMEVNHWFLAVQDKDKTYFLSLAADLSNIKNGFKTEHFARYISYMKTNRETGKKVQVYEGEKIFETELSDDILYQLDKELGYVNNKIVVDNELRITQKKKIPKGSYLVYDDFFLDYILYKQKNNNWFLELEGQKTDFYKDIYQAIPYNFRSATKSDYQYFIDTILKLCTEQVNILIDNLVNKYQHKYPMSDESVWRTTLINLIKQRKLPKAYQNDIDLKHIRKMVEDVKVLVQIKIPRFLDKISNDDYNMTDDDIKYIKNIIKESLTNISFYFIDKPDLLNRKYNNQISNSYLASKFLTVFGKIFNCNEHIENFNHLSYSEQKEIILKVIPFIFEDDNISEEMGRARFLGKDSEYPGSKKPIVNIIRLYTIKNKEDGTYSSIFHFPVYKNGDTIENEIFIQFDIQKNTLKLLKPIELTMLKQNYLIISETLNSRIQSIEDIESKRHK